MKDVLCIVTNEVKVQRQCCTWNEHTDSSCGGPISGDYL